MVQIPTDVFGRYTRGLDHGDIGVQHGVRKFRENGVQFVGVQLNQLRPQRDLDFEERQGMFAVFQFG